MLDSLSEELLLEIIYFMRDRELDGDPSRIFYPDSNSAFGSLNSLASLSFTSQKLRRIVLPALFESFIISFNETHRDSDLSTDRAIETGLRALKSRSAIFVKSIKIIIDESSSESHPYQRRLSPESEEFFVEMVKALPNLEEISFMDEESPNLTRKIVATINEHPRLRIFHVNDSLFSDDTNSPSVTDLSLHKIHCRALLVSKEQHLSARQMSWFLQHASIASLIIRPLSQPEWMEYTFSGLERLVFEQCYALSDHEAFISRHPQLRSITVMRAPFPRTAQGQAEIQTMPWLQPYLQSLGALELPVHSLVSSLILERENHVEAWRGNQITITLDATEPNSAIQAIGATCRAFPALRYLDVTVPDTLRIPSELFLEKDVLSICHANMKGISFRGIEISDESLGLSAQESRLNFSGRLAAILPHIERVSWPPKGTCLIRRRKSGMAGVKWQPLQTARRTLQIRDGF